MSAQTCQGALRLVWAFVAKTCKYSVYKYECKLMSMNVIDSNSCSQEILYL